MVVDAASVALTVVVGWVALLVVTTSEVDATAVAELVVVTAEDDFARQRFLFVGAPSAEVARSAIEMIAAENFIVA